MIHKYADLWIFADVLSDWNFIKTINYGFSLIGLRMNWLMCYKMVMNCTV